MSSQLVFGCCSLGLAAQLVGIGKSTLLRLEMALLDRVRSHERYPEKVGHVVAEEMNLLYTKYRIKTFFLQHALILSNPGRGHERHQDGVNGQRDQGFH
jgi:hypothetical protein